MTSAIFVHLPLLVIPSGGIKVVTLPRLASHLFAPYETAWAWAAKLAAANALSTVEVSALLGLSATIKFSLLPICVPRAAQTMGKKLGFPAHQIRGAFFDGTLGFLRPLVCEQLRLCPACVREGHHFILHQIRSFACCPLHGLRLSAHCFRCGGSLAYALGKSAVLGPINCPSCRMPLLPVSRGGIPEAGMLSDQAQALITRWLAFLRRRIMQPTLFEAIGVIDASKVDFTVRRERIQVCIPPKSAKELIKPSCSGRSSADAKYRCLEMVFWGYANRLWRRCHQQSRWWYRRLLKGHHVELAPTSQMLAFLYWRMAWQGCSNPYLLRRGNCLPMYGIAGWLAWQSIHDADDIDAAITEFASALESSWEEWLDCIDLLGVTELDQHTWHLRARPATFAERKPECKRG